MASGLKAIIQRRNVQLQSVMQAELENQLVAAQTYHEAAVRNWKKKPRFQLRALRQTPGVLGGQLLVTGEHQDKWKWVDRGTGKYGPKHTPYLIFPKIPGGRLTFQTDYQPKTRPIAKANVGAGRAAGDWITVAYVEHPGIKAREFTTTYVNRILQPQFAAKIVQAIQRAKPL